jgi:hypothetical protein
MDKLMLIVPAELVSKIDANRGDLSQAEFINFLIDSRLSEESAKRGAAGREELEKIRAELKKIIAKEEAVEQKYATKEELKSFMQDNRKLLKSFLDFFIGYGLEMGKQSGKDELADIISGLKGLEEELAAEGESSEVKIKWK